MARRAARTTAPGARATFGASQCHGVAGCIEFMLDMYQGHGEIENLVEAHSLAQLLEAFARHERHGGTWAVDTLGWGTDDFLVGQSGISLCLLRLADPVRRPHILSRQAYRFGSARPERPKA